MKDRIQAEAIKRGQTGAQYVRELLEADVVPHSEVLKARLEISLTLDEGRQLQDQARLSHLPLEDWVRRQLLDPQLHMADIPALNFTTDEGEIIEFSDWPPDMAHACTVITQKTQQQKWLAPDEDKL